MTVYVVTRGAYSDFRIVGVVSTEAAARAYVEARRTGSGDDHEYEAYELDALPAPPKGMQAYRVIMDREGNLHPGASYYRSVCLLGDAPQVYWRAWDRDERYFFAEVWARDEPHAIKIANERRTVARSTPEASNAPVTP